MKSLLFATKHNSKMLLLISIVIITAQVFAKPDSCPQPTPMKKFNIASYANGRWFEIARYKNFNIEAKADCVIFDYSPEGNGYFFKLREIVNKKEDVFTANVNLAPGAGDTAVLLYNVHRNGEFNVTMSIIDTDYESYAVFYCCRINEATGTPTISGFIKSRTPSITPEAKAKVDKIIAATPLLDASKFEWDHFTHDACLIDV